MLEMLLLDHPDRAYVTDLISSLRIGADVLMQREPQVSFECKNLQSANKDPLTVDRLIAVEVERGYLSGPYDVLPFYIYRVNSVGLSYGKYTKKARLIVDCSSPHENDKHPSINSLINKEDCTLKYIRIDDAIIAIHKSGRKSKLCKVDVTDAFKIYPIRQDLWRWHCIKWRSKYYFFMRLCFGSRISCKIFDKLSRAISWIATRHYQIETIFHLLDDFLTVDDPAYPAHVTMDNLKRLFSDLNIPLAEHKTSGPTTCLEFLGIILDTQAMEARLPLEKLERIYNLIESLSRRHTVTKVELLQILGHFNFAARVIPIGRSFVSHMIELSTKVKQLHHHITIDHECREELRMWVSFLKDWNGVSIFLEPTVTDAFDLELFTDSSGTLGFGAYWQGKWFQGRWPENIRVDTDPSISMAFLELFPICICALLFGPLWCTKRILVHCDNQATVHIIRKSRSRSPPVNQLMRELSLAMARYNFAITAQYIKSGDNNIADALSRFQMRRFRMLAPHAEATPLQIPRHMWDLLQQTALYGRQH